MGTPIQRSELKGSLQSDDFVYEIRDEEFASLMVIGVVGDPCDIDDQKDEIEDDDGDEIDERG